MDREDRAKKVMFQRVVLGIFAVLVVIAIVVGIRSCAKKDDSAKVTTVKGEACGGSDPGEDAGCLD